MIKYRVKIKYGNPGEYKHNSQTIDVIAENESTAKRLAIEKFRDSNSIYKNKDAEVVSIQELPS